MNTKDEPEDTTGEIVPPGVRKTCEWLTVLEAAAIDCEVVWTEAEWVIHVAPNLAVAAQEEISAYETVNRDWPPPEPGAVPPAQRKTFASLSSWWVAGFLAAFYAWLGPYAHDNDVLSAAAMERAAIDSGEWWRLVTALTIHGDASHLVGNMVSIGLFGMAVCSLVGPGLAWLAILIAAVGGNALAVSLQSAHSVSVGASTACFAALGILCGHRTMAILSASLNSRVVSGRMWLAVGSGLALLGILGTGPNSNLAAHAFGFLCGLVVGVPLFYAARCKIRSGWHQFVQLLLLCSVMMCWRKVLGLVTGDG